MRRVVVPSYAKMAAKRGLDKRKSYTPSQRPGLDKKQANKLGINSGVERAKQIIRSKSLSEKDAQRVSAFYSRFRNCRTPRCEVAINLWGGRRFGKKLSEQ
jgi:hypothetical protein